MRAQLRKLTIQSLGALKRPGNGVHIINAHYLDSHKDSDTGANFVRQLEHISKHGKLIRIEEAVDLIRRRITVNQPLVAFTFDDGFLDCYKTISPILENFNTNAAFFINPNLVECEQTYYDEFSRRVTVNGKKIMDWSQIVELYQRGHIIGSHTMDHVNLGNEFSDDELEYQIVFCKRIIEKKINGKCDLFAYPYGGLNNLSAQALAYAKDNHDFVFSGTNYKHYHSFNGQVINRRHIEPYWSVPHVNYFLSVKKNHEQH